MSEFKIVGIKDEEEENSIKKDFDVGSLMKNEKFVRIVRENSVDMGEGERAFCIDVSNYRELFQDICLVDTDVSDKSELSCDPLGWLSDKIDGIKENNIVEKNGSKKYCIIFNEGVF